MFENLKKARAELETASGSMMVKMSGHADQVRTAARALDEMVIGLRALVKLIDTLAEKICSASGPLTIEEYDLLQQLRQELEEMEP